MEVGSYVWIRSDQQEWIPAVITKREQKVRGNVKLTLRNDDGDPHTGNPHQFCPSPTSVGEFDRHREPPKSSPQTPDTEFRPDGRRRREEICMTADPKRLHDNPDIKLQNRPGDGPDGVAIVGGAHDLSRLTHLHEPAILHALRLRHESDVIYTSTGSILLAVNPFKKLDLYGEAVMERYRVRGEETEARRGTLPPHPYQTADCMYREMMRGLGEGKRLDQFVLVSGESGAGKTVTTKIVLEYLAMLSRKKQEDASGPDDAERSDGTSCESISMETQILDTNPILEGFGNARTMRNDNSSRFGKYIDISFTPDGRVSDASIQTYLLEKVRLIHPRKGERNYHVFYQFLASATPQSRESSLLGDLCARDFKILSDSGTFDRRDGIRDEAMHEEMMEAMAKSNFDTETVANLMRLVAAILFFGNIHFGERSQDSCEMSNTRASESSATLLGVDYLKMKKALTCRNIFVGTEVLTKPLTAAEARKGVGALIGAIYGAMFDYIVEKINISIHKKVFVAEETIKASTGILDIFGFEVFEKNNFEQLCINYTNEVLQQQFNKFVFKLEQQEYHLEDIPWKFIAFHDNQDVLDLIDGRRTGIFSLLDEQCILPRSTDERFTRNLYKRCDIHPRFKATSSQKGFFRFSVEHFAGPVEYETKGWLEKNKDQLQAASADLLSDSNSNLLLEIKKYIHIEKRSDRGFATKSVGTLFSAQLSSLRKRIDGTVLRHIRCLRSNDSFVPNAFEAKKVAEQLRCGGVFEAVQVSRAGYPTRYVHDDFLARYGVIMSKKEMSLTHLCKEDKLYRLLNIIAFHVWKDKSSKREEGKERPLVIIPRISTKHQLRVTTGKSKDPFTGSKTKFAELDFTSRCIMVGMQLGKTKIFMKQEAHYHVETVRSKIIAKVVTVMQAMVRRSLSRSRFLQSRVAAIKMQGSVRMWLVKLHAWNLKRFRAASRIQHVWKFIWVKETFSRCIVEMKRRIVSIQRWCRQCLEQKRLREIRRRELASIKIQTACRRKLLFLSYHRSSRSIQAVVRGKICRSRFLVSRFSAVTIQSTARMQFAKTEARHRRRDDAARKIQNYWRFARAANAIWHCVVEFNQRATVIQRCIRRNFMKKRIKAMMRNRTAAVTIQSLWRGAHVRFRRNMAARTIQKHVRYIKSRDKILQCIYKMKQNIIVIQKWHRRRIMKKRLKEIVKRQKCAAKIQALWRGFWLRNIIDRAARIIQRKWKVKRLHLKCKMIQKWYRAMMPRIRLNRAVTRMKAAIKIQAYWKVHRGVKIYGHLIKTEFYHHVDNQNWDMAERLLDRYPMMIKHKDESNGQLIIHELASMCDVPSRLIHKALWLSSYSATQRDDHGSLPIHIAAEQNNFVALKIIHANYTKGIRTIDGLGRLPLHVAAEFDSLDALKFLLRKNPQGAYTSTPHINLDEEGGGVPFHYACRNNASLGTITTLLVQNHDFAKRSDDNGDLPLHLLLRCGGEVDTPTVDVLLTCFSSAVSKVDQHGDLPLAIALQSCCVPAVVMSLLYKYPEAARRLSGDCHSALHLAVFSCVDDTVVADLLNLIPEFATLCDNVTSLYPIEVATKNNYSNAIIRSLLLIDMPIKLKDKQSGKYQFHKYSWNHIVCNSDDKYHIIVCDLLKKCTKPQITALADAKGPDGITAFTAATPYCKKHILRMLRYYNVKLKNEFSGLGLMNAFDNVMDEYILNPCSAFMFKK